MFYDIYSNNEQIANGLSPGELNQWLLDLDDELTGDEKYRFRRDLGAKDGVNFEEYLYSITISVPLKLAHGEDNLAIVENDF